MSEHAQAVAVEDADAVVAGVGDVHAPRRRDGELMGPERVWLRLLAVVERWIGAHLNRRSRALAMLRESLLRGT